MAEHRARTFKSGNSVALRIPKALGLSEGEEVTIIPHRDGSFSLIKTDDRKAAFVALSGAMSPGWMAGGRHQGGDVERDWSPPGDTASAA